MANLMLALPEILVVLRGPDPHSCLLCLQGAERKIRDEERKQSKRKGKCVGPIPRECLAAAVSCSPSLDLQSAGWIGERVTWPAPAPRPSPAAVEEGRRLLTELQAMSWVGSGFFGCWVLFTV